MNDIFKMAEQAYHALSIAESELKRLYKENAELKNSLKQSEQGVIMTDLRKAAEMALETLCVGANDAVPNDIDERFEQAIQALRQALAQPVDAVNMSQERVDETAKCKQEPYGYVWTSLRDGMEVRFSRMPPNKFYNPQDIKPVYTAPPKREWVGLTDEEIEQGLLRSDYALQTAHAWRSGVIFAMTKLKEKNNG